MLVHAPAGRLDDKHVGATDVLQHLHVSFTVGKARDRGLAPLQAKKSANLFGQRLVGRAAEDLEFLVRTARLGLALRLWLRLGLALGFFGCSRYSSHFFTPFEASWLSPDPSACKSERLTKIWLGRSDSNLNTQ